MELTKRAKVSLSKFAAKQLKKLPGHIQESYLVWVISVETTGILKARLIPGYHDEPLKGKRTGQRSVRLSRSYRVIYEISSSNELDIIGVMEINKHDY